MSIPIGAKATLSEVVTRELTVAHFHQGSPEVYGTPLMIYLMEVTANEAIREYLPPGWGTVGVAVDVRHLAATPMGMTVTATAEVIAVGERTVTFRVEASDGIDRIGEGTHVRAPVELARFNAGVEQKRRRR